MEKFAELMQSMPGPTSKSIRREEEHKAFLFQKRNKLEAGFQKYLLQFDSNGFVFDLDDTYDEDDMYFRFTEKPLALTTINGETFLKSSRDASGALLLEFEDGEKFYPHDHRRKR